MHFSQVSALLLLASACTPVGAFVATMPSSSSSRTTTTTSGSCNSRLQYHQHLSEIDEMCIENAAQFCLDEGDTAGLRSMECDLDEHEALVNSLQDARLWHQQRLESIDELLAKLRGHEQDMKEPNGAGGLRA